MINPQDLEIVQTLTALRVALTNDMQHKNKELIEKVDEQLEELIDSKES